MANIIVKEKLISSSISTNICATKSRVNTLQSGLPLTRFDNSSSYSDNQLVCAKDIVSYYKAMIYDVLLDNSHVVISNNDSSVTKNISAAGGSGYAEFDYVIKFLIFKLNLDQSGLKILDQNGNTIDFDLKEFQTDPFKYCDKYEYHTHIVLTGNTITGSNLGTTTTSVTLKGYSTCQLIIPYNEIKYIQENFNGCDRLQILNVSNEKYYNGIGYSTNEKSETYEFDSGSISIYQDANTGTAKYKLTIDPDLYVFSKKCDVKLPSKGGVILTLLFKWNGIKYYHYTSGCDSADETVESEIKYGTYFSLSSYSTISGQFINSSNGGLLFNYGVNLSNVEEKKLILIVTYSNSYGSCTQTLNTIYQEKGSTGEELLLNIKFGYNNIGKGSSINSRDEVSGNNNPINLNSNCSWTANGLLINNVSRGSYAAYMNIGSTSKYYAHLLSDLQSYEVGYTIVPTTVNSYSTGSMCVAQLGQYGTSNSTGIYYTLSNSNTAITKNQTYTVIWRRYLNGQNYHWTLRINGTIVSEDDGSVSLRRSSTIYTPLYFGTCPYIAHTGMSYLLKEFYIKKI